jgi:murein DD-endopeptidase MepM/ murein hydrolase activator NlpD
MPDNAILLLPRENYWKWVEAARDYVLKFGANLTPDPATAGNYMFPKQVVTIAGLPNGYPVYGDIQVWFRQNYPNVSVDYIPALSPQAFHAALQRRIDANNASLIVGVDFRLRWPTDYYVIVQPFGVNPDLYRRWDLPGHEGIDIRAPQGANIYACADGTVERVDVYQGDPAIQPYGNSLRLRHADGYLTIYAHLQQTLVRVGDAVHAGQVIGLADATGNTAGSHLHLSLKKDGATAAGLTPFPKDFLDPLPYLNLAAPIQLTAADYPWPPRMCLSGVHCRAGEPVMHEADYAALQPARLEAVKLLTWTLTEELDRLRAFNPNYFVLARLMTKIGAPNQFSDFFVSEVVNDMARFYERGVRYFEVHNEPNLTMEGWKSSWQDGRDFNRFFLEVYAKLKARFPEARLGYPGLSPDGIPAPGIRMNDLIFLAESDEAARTADWIGVHCYWQSEAEMSAERGGFNFQEYRRRYPNQLLFVTEFSNVAPAVDKRTKGQQYSRYYQMVRNVPGLGGVFSFILSSTQGFETESWRDEAGNLSDIPAQVATRTGLVIPPPPVPPA